MNPGFLISYTGTYKKIRELLHYKLCSLVYLHFLTFTKNSVSENAVNFKRLKAKFLAINIEMRVRFCLCSCVAGAAPVIYLLVGSA